MRIHLSLHAHLSGHLYCKSIPQLVYTFKINFTFQPYHTQTIYELVPFMSNPPFGSPFYSEEEDFSFPINEAPNDPNNNNPFVIQETSPIPLPNSSIPISSECQDWSMFLDDHHTEDFPLLGKIPSTSQETPNDWLLEIDDHSLDDLVEQGAPGSSDEHGLFEHHPYLRNIDHDQHHQTDNGDIGQGSSGMKLDHNARERIRRKKLTTSYSALQSMLPDSKRASYKRWTAPYTLDRTLDYIPKLEAEIEKLTLEKSNLLSQIGKQQQEAVLQSEDGDKRVANRFKHTLTVSINEVKTGELIIQICQHKGILDHKFSALIEKLEGEDIRVMGASSQCVSQHRSCFHLHVQMGENQIEADYVANLQKKLINWLC